jgi:hypothetical protein
MIARTRRMAPTWLSAFHLARQGGAAPPITLRTATDPSRLATTRRVAQLAAIRHRYNVTIHEEPL